MATSLWSMLLLTIMVIFAISLLNLILLHIIPLLEGFYLFRVRDQLFYYFFLSKSYNISLLPFFLDWLWSNCVSWIIIPILIFCILYLRLSISRFYHLLEELFHTATFQLVNRKSNFHFHLWVSSLCWVFPPILWNRCPWKFFWK